MTPTLEDIRRAAFVDHGPARLRLAESGPLADLTFAVKDLIDVAGFVTACGNPDRLRDGVKAGATAPCVLPLLAAGATCLGKTHTDEVACGMFGTNPHFGTPINPRAPDRVPGGSSSGSASAVAAGLVDFALGTDTGGSVRVPASFCGLSGIRTSFGRISTAGVMAMAPSFDTVGWLARDADVLRRVGETYFGKIEKPKQTRFLLARDAFDILRREIGEPLLDLARRLDGAPVTLYEEGVRHWLETFRPLQLHELWATLGAWASAPGRTLSPGVRERIAWSAQVPPHDVAAATVWREALTQRLATLLGDDGVLILPTAHELPPPRDASLAALVDFREKTLALTSVASLTRLPQINVPVTTIEGCPVGLSFIAGPRGDERLLGLAQDISLQLSNGPPR